MAIKHYLITRFNLRVPQWRRTDKRGQRTLTSQWMRHRFALFNKHTVPSVLRQENKDFTWLVLFDASTRISDDTPYIPLSLTQDWLYELQAYLTGRAEWIITTRLDNDDAIEPSFMSVVRANFQPRTMFLNIPNGMIQRPNGSEACHHQANPFMSFIEPGDDPKSIYFTPHGRAMERHAPIKQIITKRLWTQIIHERNYIND